MSYFIRFLTIFLSLSSFSVFGEIQAEPSVSLKLPQKYGNTWLFAHGSDVITILDVAATSHQYKGVLQALHNANFVESKRRNELYVAETVYSRGTYGERTDLITIYDKVNISPIAEIILPENKRGLLMSQKGSFQLTRNEQFALVFNFTPATSVYVVDMDKRQVVNEVQTPGCYQIYPSGVRSFSSLCSNGSVATFLLNKDGQLINETLSKPFNDIDADPLFMRSATIDGITYFPSFKGRLQPINMKTDKVRVLESWSLLSKEDQVDDWRPSGLQLITADEEGKLYILMHKNAVDGDHTQGGNEVWVFDVAQKKRTARIALQKAATSIEVTQGKHPYLSASNKDGAVDVYQVSNGLFVHTINFGITPTVMHAAK